jgi:hypothetical protein
MESTTAAQLGRIVDMAIVDAQHRMITEGAIRQEELRVATEEAHSGKGGPQQQAVLRVRSMAQHMTVLFNQEPDMEAEDGDGTEVNGMLERVAYLGELLHTAQELRLLDDGWRNVENWVGEIGGLLLQQLATLPAPPLRHPLQHGAMEAYTYVMQAQYHMGEAAGAELLPSEVEQLYRALVCMEEAFKRLRYLVGPGGEWKCDACGAPMQLGQRTDGPLGMVQWLCPACGGDGDAAGAAEAAIRAARTSLANPRSQCFGAWANGVEECVFDCIDRMGCRLATEAANQKEED